MPPVTCSYVEGLGGAVVVDDTVAVVVGVTIYIFINDDDDQGPFVFLLWFVYACHIIICVTLWYFFFGVLWGWVMNRLTNQKRI